MKLKEHEINEEELLTNVDNLVHSMSEKCLIIEDKIRWMKEILER